MSLRGSEEREGEYGQHFACVNVPLWERLAPLYRSVPFARARRLGQAKASQSRPARASHISISSLSGTDAIST